MALSSVTQHFNWAVGDLQRDYLFQIIITSLPENFKLTLLADTKLDAKIVNAATLSPKGLMDYKFEALNLHISGYQNQVPTSNTALHTIRYQMDLLTVKGVWPKRETALIEKKWEAKKYYFAGADASPKSGELVFEVDARFAIVDFWDTCMDFTGSLGNHAQTLKPYSGFDFILFMWDTRRERIADARLFQQVQVVGVDVTQPDKSGSSTSQCTVKIAWDHVRRIREVRDFEFGSTDPEIKGDS